ncbi:sperm protein associated with the nucleus on the X chromosome N4 isoform X2 [Pongo abelii]|uniref:sperm protein associated with the nucleus on the X chromosome N4 isoform X2 n=1 Tax=Pongo abelii TaxID=9601 RepID=UPI0023E886D7|nr:sperm protein associated with the nucleus on the X chromosome N4 isoform X2 [Pongo abelii]
MAKQSSRVWLCLAPRRVYIQGGQKLWDSPLESFNTAVEICTLEDPSIEILQPTIIMEEPTSSTKGNKMKSPCESSKRKVDKKKNLDRASALEQSLKETEKAKYPTLVFYYRKNKKRNSNQLENNQLTESSTDPIKEKGDLDISAGSPQDGGQN